MPPMSRMLSTNRSPSPAASSASAEAQSTLGGLRRLFMACELDELARTLSREREQTQPRTRTPALASEPSESVFWPFVRRRV